MTGEPTRGARASARQSSAGRRVIKALPVQRADEAFGIGVLPGGTWRDRILYDAEAGDSASGLPP